MKTKAFIRALAFLVLLIVVSCGKEDDPVKKQLDPPSDLSAVVFSATQINLAWVDQSTGETGFRIERAPGGTSAFVEVGSVGSGVITFQNTGLDPNTLYTYRVKAFSRNSNSIYSSSISIATPDVPPAAPTNLTAMRSSGTQIDLNWTDNSTNEQGFKIEQALGVSEIFTQIITAPTGATAYQHTGLITGTEYRYRVVAFNASGNSTYSNTAAATTHISIAAPANLLATVASGTQIDLQWADNSDNEDGFKIERAPGSTTTFTEIGTVGAGVAVYHNTGLAASTSYTYRVRAYKETENSPYSNIFTATTSSSILSAPTNLEAMAISTGQINLGWLDNSNNEDGFNIERAPASTTTFLQIATVGPDVSAYQNIRLAANTGYVYRVRSFNSGGNSTYSNTAAATTFPAAPVISAPATSTGLFKVTLTYTWPEMVSSADYYEFEESTTSSLSGFTVVHTSRADTHTSPYMLSLSKTAGTYYYRARVNSSSVWSGHSNVIQVTVEAPSTLTVYATEDNTLGLSTTNSGLAGTVMKTGLLFCGCDFAIGPYVSNFICGSAAIKFGTLQSQISGRNVSRAKLIVYVASLPADISTTFAVNAFTAAWSSASITYNNKPNFYSSAQVNFTPPSTSLVPVQLDITQIVKNWASGTFANNGLIMRDLATSFPSISYLRMTGFESVDDYSNTSKRPKIVVEFQ